jgi:hypothetical protein
MGLEQVRRRLKTRGRNSREAGMGPVTLPGRGQQSHLTAGAESLLLLQSNPAEGAVL